MSAAERSRVRENVRKVDFPIALRGYDRAAVDRYVQQVNHLIAEFEISSSPESAIRHALEEVSEETSGLLQHAYQTADEITARSRAKADDRLQQAEREAAEARDAAGREAQDTRETAQRESQELRATATREAHALRQTVADEAQQTRAAAQQEIQDMLATARQEIEEMRTAAEARVGELDRDAKSIWRERRRLIEDMRAVAQQQLEIAEEAAVRFPQAEAGAEESVHVAQPDRAAPPEEVS